jgi:zinc D-Ala-D-Ala dipeptidase
LEYWKIFFIVFSMGMTSLTAQSEQEVLVDLSNVNPNIVLDMKYAGEDNFLQRAVYADSRCFLLAPLARRLDEAQKILQQDGLGLKVYDCYRSVEVQKKMWELVPDARYVANPYEGGSKHNRGVAVDLTLVDSQGRELEMPTPFDTFSERAHLFGDEPTPRQRANRALLRMVLEKAGLVPLQTEWWHYELPEGEKYPILEAGPGGQRH